MAGEKILLADDDHPLRETLQEFLTEAGVRGDRGGGRP